MRIAEYKHKFAIRISCLLILVVVVLQPMQAVQAITIYGSDGIAHEEGYIFVGESHINISCAAVREIIDNQMYVPGVKDVHYVLDWTYDTVDPPDNPRKFVMSGNLFFVFGSMDPTDDGSIQATKEYIYSDGRGEYGVAVTKIHNIIETNPNIAHWNIISWQGAVQAAKTVDRSIPDYYVASYRNWIDYEFPEADVYFLPITTMTKYYRSAKKAELFNQVLKETFPDHFLDYTEFFEQRYPQGLMDPRQRSDSLHWSSQTYVELITDIIREIQHRRGMDRTVTDVDAVLYTNDNTVVYSIPDCSGNVLFANVETGLPVHVTGVTDNGFFRVDLGEMTAYIHGIGLRETEK